jgi:hypothetical protein
MTTNSRYGEAWHIHATRCQRAEPYNKVQYISSDHIQVDLFDTNYSSPWVTVVIRSRAGAPPSKSSPAVSSFCPTLGWLHLVKIVSHRSTVHVALPAPIVFNVPDMWIRAEDNLLVQTISTNWDVWWNRVAEETPDRLPQQCRARYMPAAFLAQLTWVFLRISVDRVRCTPACVSNDNRSKDSDTATIADASMTAEMAFLSTQLPRRPPPRSRMYTGM